MAKKYTIWTEKKLDKFFDDNFLEWDELYELLKGNEAILKISDDNEIVITMPLKEV